MRFSRWIMVTNRVRRERERERGERGGGGTLQFEKIKLEDNYCLLRAFSILHKRHITVKLAIALSYPTYPTPTSFSFFSKPTEHPTTILFVSVRHNPWSCFAFLVSTALLTKRLPPSCVTSISSGNTRLS